MGRFIADEATLFTGEENNAGVAEIDAGVEKFVRLSSEKNKTNVKILQKEMTGLQSGIRDQERSTRKDMKNLRKKTDELNHQKIDLNQRLESGKITVAQAKMERAKLQEEEKFISSEADRIFGKENEVKFSKLEKRERKSEKKKEKKKAASKTAVANMLKGKKDVANDLANMKESTGNAFSDVNSGLIGTFAVLVNPMTYVKKFIAQIGALIAPYVLLFMSVVMLLVIIIALLFQILSPIAAVGNALNSFLSIFSVDTATFTNAELTEDEIDGIIADAECGEMEETVLRFALSKVGYPYSQDLRKSGSAYDCSSLAYYAWKEAGVDISFGTGYPPSAAEGARILNEKGLAVASDDVAGFSLEPGDLVYYAGSANGRYLGIYHVAIYAGNGKAVEALNTKYGVVLQTLRTEKAIMVIRPNK